jgi:hypothetical protein
MASLKELKYELEQRIGRQNASELRKLQQKYNDKLSQYRSSVYRNRIKRQYQKEYTNWLDAVRQRKDEALANLEQEYNQRRSASKSRSGGSLPRSLIRSLQSGTRSANRANEARYRAVLSTLAGMGEGRIDEINRQSRTNQALARQSLINRGLGNTTVMTPISNRIRESADRRITDVRERVAGNRANIMASRTDAAPSIGPALEFLYRYGRTR